MSWAVRINYKPGECGYLNIEFNHSNETKTIVDQVAKSLSGKSADKSMVFKRDSYVIVIKNIGDSVYEVISDSGNRSFTLGVLFKALESLN